MSNLCNPWLTGDLVLNLHSIRWRNEKHTKRGSKNTNAASAILIAGWKRTRQPCERGCWRSTSTRWPSSRPCRLAKGIRRAFGGVDEHAAPWEPSPKLDHDTSFASVSKDQELSALYCQDAPHGAPRLLLDPNELSSDRTITLADTHPSRDGSLIAYRLSVSGSSRMSLYVMDVDSKEVLPDVIPGEVNPVAHAWHYQKPSCVAP